MPVPTDDSRRGGLPGTPPRFVVVLASAGLVALTGAAVWLLPAEAGPPGGLAAGSTAPAVGSATELAGMERQRRLVVLPPERRPSGYVTYVHTASEPRFSPAAEMRRTGVRWYALGHLTAGPDGCTPKWGGTTDQGRDPVANRLARLRAAGGDVSLLFGGGGGRELAETCADTRALTAAYRRVIGAFDPPHIDFELAAPPASVPLPAGSGGAATGPGQGDPRPMGTALPLPPQGAAAAQREPASAVRRARALRALKRQAMSEGRSLDVGFTVPAGASGLAEGHRAVLRATRGAGGPVDTVTLLVPLRRTPDSSQLRRLAESVRVSRAQIAADLGLSPLDASRRIALTPVLAGPGDLSPMEARKLSAYAMRNQLAWLSLRGARPAEAVVRTLSSAHL